jgi:hypothetical protein
LIEDPATRHPQLTLSDFENLPKPTDQQILACLLRLERLILYKLADEDTPYTGPPLEELIQDAFASGHIKPTETPFMKRLEAKEKKAKHK